MARRTPVKSRPVTPPVAKRTSVRASPRPRRRPTTKRTRAPAPPLLSADQQRELVGIALIGAGVVLACILALPDGGSIAQGVHDSVFHVLGIGAWLGAAGLVLTGARTCGEKQWRGGILAAVGSLVTVAALLGLLGLISPGSTGGVGENIANATSRRLGGAASTVALLVIACAGLVPAVDLRVGRIAKALTVWWQEQRVREAERRAVELAEQPIKPVESKLAKRESTAELRGRRVPVTVDPSPIAIEHIDLEEPPSVLFPEIVVPDPSMPLFQREFESSVVEPADASGKETLGPIPDVELPHTGDLAEEDEKIWVLPHSDLLDVVVGKRERLVAEVEVTKAKIVNTLKSFGIETRIIGANSGPTVTQYELQPAAGVPVRKIVSYQTDLSLALAAPIRIQPFIAGKSAIGIEVPNKAAQLVSLKDVVAAPVFRDPRTRLNVVLGADVSGHPVVGDLTRMPHLLIAGATGSGKSVCINALLAGLLLTATPKDLKLILIDPKRVEMSNYADLPHLLVPVVVEPEAAVASLRWAVKEMEERYKLFASHSARNIAVFNEKAPGLGLAPLPYTVIIIDELADLMMVAAGEIEDLICRIAQLARAVGIHLVVATQRPSADIITGLIKANIPSRVAFAVSSGVDSRVILDEMGAEKLLGRGDMLYLPIDEGKARRLQGAYVSDRELDALINHWKQQGKPDYQEEIFNVQASVSWAKDAGKRDPLFAKAAHTVAAEGRAAASLLQRKLSVGYTRAARLVDQLQEYRVVGPYEGSKSRDVLMDVIQVDELLADLGEE